MSYGDIAQFEGVSGTQYCCCVSHAEEASDVLVVKSQHIQNPVLTDGLKLAKVI